MVQPQRGWAIKKTGSEILKSMFSQTGLAGGLPLLRMFCSVGLAATSNALRERNNPHSQRGHCLGSGESRLIPAAATRGPFTARNKKRHHSCSLFRAPAELPARGSAPRVCGAHITASSPSAVAFFYPPKTSCWVLFPPKLWKDNPFKVLAVASPWLEGGQMRRWFLVTK